MPPSAIAWRRHPRSDARDPAITNLQPGRGRLCPCFGIDQGKAEIQFAFLTGGQRTACCHERAAKQRRYANFCHFTLVEHLHPICKTSLTFVKCTLQWTELMERPR